MFQHFFGWYDTDKALPAIRHRLTGQTLAFAGRIAPGELPGVADSINRHWMRFTYSDPEIRTDLLVESLLSPGTWGRVWYLDYERSFPGRPPDFGLWQRLDSFVVDALACFPRGAALGEAATEITAVGAWHLGAWQDAVVRSQKLPVLGWCLGNPPVLSGYLSRLDDKPAVPWQVCQAGEAAEQLPALKALEAAVAAGRGGPKLPAYFRERLAAAPFLSRKDGRALLIALPSTSDKAKTPSPLSLAKDYGRAPHPSLNFYYLDEDCLYYALHIHQTRSRDGELNFGIWPFTPPELLRLRIEGFVPGELPGYDDPVAPGKSSRGDALGPDKKCPMMPQWLGLRLRHAALSGLEALFEAEAAPLARQHWRCDFKLENFADGSDRPYVLANNGAEIAARRRDDGVLRASSLQRVHGWWDFDPAAPGMINRNTGQKITLHEDDRLAESLWRRPKGFDNWWLLTYSDGEVSYSVPVGRQDTPHEDRRFGWAVLYDQREAPPYGLWRRAHLAIVDALSCWPTTNAFGHASGTVFTLGAWSNGRWHKDLCNCLQWRYGNQRRDSIPEAEPMVPALAAEPSPWTFVDATTATGKGWLEGLTWERGNDPRRMNSNEGRRDFSCADRPLGGRVSFPFTGFEHEGPYLRRADGSAVFFPARLSSGVFADLRGEFPRYEAQIAFLYADRDTVALFHSKHIRWLDFDLQHMAILESDGADGMQRWLAGGETPGSTRVPTYAWWLTLQEKFAGLGMAWRGSPAQLHDDPAQIERLRKSFPKRWGEMNEPEPLGLGACQTSRLIGTFRGGIFEPGLGLDTSWSET